MSNLRQYTVRANAITTLRFNARMLAAFRKQTTLRAEVEYYPSSTLISVPSGQPPASSSPVTQITSSQEQLSTTIAIQFLRNEPPTSTTPSWILSGHREADQQILNALDLRSLPDGFDVPCLRAGRPMGRSNPPSASHIRSYIHIA